MRLSNQSEPCNIHSTPNYSLRSWKQGSHKQTFKKQNFLVLIYTSLPDLIVPRSSKYTISWTPYEAWFHLNLFIALTFYYIFFFWLHGRQISRGSLFHIFSRNVKFIFCANGTRQKRSWIYDNFYKLCNRTRKRIGFFMKNCSFVFHSWLQLKRC